jgi:putative ABC transport system substrate-binding protein
MKRREFITLLGGAAAAWPLAAGAQQPEPIRRIGVLMSIAAGDPEGQRRARSLEKGLAERGWVLGQNIEIEYRWAGGNASVIPKLAVELVSMRPDVMLANSTPVLAALAPASNSIPIVFTNVSDPVGGGFVESLAHPNKQITGFTDFEYPISGKWLEILKEAVPRLTTVIVLINPDTASGQGYLPAIQRSAAMSGIRLLKSDVMSAADIERAINDATSSQNAGIIVLPSLLTVAHRKLIVSLSSANQIPTIYPYRVFAIEGGLVSYGIDTVDLYYQASSYIDRILRGAKPADLPVQAPNKFELLINLKTAKALGLTVPPSLLTRADEVIE